MQINLKLYSLLVVLMSSISACKISQPEFRSVENFKLSRDNANFAVGGDVVFYNPNRVRFTVQNIVANVFVNEQKIGTIGKEANLKIKGKSEFKLPIAISLNGDDILKNLPGSLEALFKKREINMRVSGNVKFKAYLLLKKEMPFQFQKKLSF